MNQTPAATEPISDDTDQDLADNDADDFEVAEGVDPGLAAYGVMLPAAREGGLEKRRDVANREENVTEALSESAEAMETTY